MKKRFLLFCIAALAVLNAGTVPAESSEDSDSHTVEITISEVANLRVYEGTTVEIGIEGPDSAGASPRIIYTNADSNYLQYSSIVLDGQTRKITGAITGASGVPDGVVLRVTPATAAGYKVGAVGSAVGTAVTLSGTAQDIVTGIGSGYTGTADIDGVNLSYSVTLTPEDLKATGTATVEVTYTLADGA